MELFVPSFEGERKRSTRPAMRVLTAGTARAYIHDLLPPRPLSRRPATPDTPFILLILAPRLNAGEALADPGLKSKGGLRQPSAVLQ